MTAIVYDWLISMGGGEKTLEAILDVISGPIYTLVADKKRLGGTPFHNKDIRTSFLQRMPLSQRLYRYYLPLFPKAIERLDVSAYPYVLSVSHAVAKGIVTHPHQLHLCYCFTPMRYAWDLRECYLQTVHSLQKMLAKAALDRMRMWDIASLSRVDHFATLSHYVAKRIQRIYGREAQVIYPPVETEKIILKKREEGYYLTVSRLVPYKRVDLIVEAFSHCPDKKLVVIGDGPEMANVKRRAGKNIEILGHRPDVEVHEHLRCARGFVFAAEEDFGIAPVEAQAAGTPVLAFKKGGVLETVIPEETGIFFDEQTVSSMIGGLHRFENKQWDPEKIRRNALAFSKERFQREFAEFVQSKIEAFHENRYLSRR